MQYPARGATLPPAPSGMEANGVWWPPRSSKPLFRRGSVEGLVRFRRASASQRLAIGGSRLGWGAKPPTANRQPLLSWTNRIDLRTGERPLAFSHRIDRHPETDVDRLAVQRRRRESPSHQLRADLVVQLAVRRMEADGDDPRALHGAAPADQHLKADDPSPAGHPPLFRMGKRILAANELRERLARRMKHALRARRRPLFFDR